MGLKISQKLMKAAIHWAESTSAKGLRQGRKLTQAELRTARDMGVLHPELIRLVVGPVPLPTSGLLKAAMARMGIGDDVEGLTLGYALLIHQDFSGPTDFVLAHECRHVHQFEGTDGLASFIRIYLEQIAEFGYLLAPWEVDARNAAWILEG